MTSRETSEARMPSWPIEMPSETEIVPNSIGKPPAARTPSLAALASRASDRLHGVISFHDEAMPTCGLSTSSSVMPTARSIARAGARRSPSVTSVLRGLLRVLTRVHLGRPPPGPARRAAARTGSTGVAPTVRASSPAVERVRFGPEQDRAGAGARAAVRRPAARDVLAAAAVAAAAAARGRGVGAAGPRGRRRRAARGLQRAGPPHGRLGGGRGRRRAPLRAGAAAAARRPAACR